MATESALLRARGVEIILGGKPYRLRYDFDALEQLETEFDGLDQFLNELAAWSKRYRTIRRALVVGLAREASEDEIVALLNENPDQAPDLMVLILNAMSEAMGVDVTLEAKEADPKATGSGDSPGGSSTTSPLSVLDGQTLSSGE